MAPSLVLYMGWCGLVEYEFRKEVRDVLIVLYLERFAPLSKRDTGMVGALLWLDGCHLDRDALGIFQNFEALCQQIVQGELTAYDGTHPRVAELDPQIRRVGKGPVTENVRQDAAGFLQFLKDNPEFWPPQFDEDGNVLGPPYESLRHSITPCFSTDPRWDRRWIERSLSHRLDKPELRDAFARGLRTAMTDPGFDWRLLVSGLGEELKARLTSLEATRDWLRSEIIEPYGFDVPHDES